MKVRLKQLSFWSIVKIGLVTNIVSGLLVSFLIAALEIAGVRSSSAPDTLWVLLFAGVFAGLLIGAFFTLLFIVAGALLRILPWRGPELEIEDAGVTLARHFE